MISGALTLLNNAVIAYNTWKLHQVLEWLKDAGRPVPSDAILAHIAPLPSGTSISREFIAFRWKDTSTGCCPRRLPH